MSQTVPKQTDYLLGNESEIHLDQGNAWCKIEEETAGTMKNKEELERLMSQRWPKLKKRAQHETNPEKLIAILEEIDDLLFSVEMRIAAQNGRPQTRDRTDSRSVRLDLVTSPPTTQKSGANE